MNVRFRVIDITVVVFQIVIVIIIVVAIIIIITMTIIVTIVIIITIIDIRIIGIRHRLGQCGPDLPIIEVGVVII